ncbi:hypothetical protein LXL04_017099 [Taraxacum kok-saghyz]
MGFSKFYMVLFLASLMAHNYIAISLKINADIVIGFTEDERNALLALKAGFRSTFLDEKWQSFDCLDWYGVNCSDNRVVGVTLENLDIYGEVNLDAFYNLTSLSVLSFKNNSLFGQLMDFSRNVDLMQLDLSSNRFNGVISPSLVNLVLLQSLKLQDNNLSGSIPWFDQSSLKELNLSNNNLSGPIPDTKKLQSFNESCYDHNSFLCGPPSSTSCSDTAPPGGDNSGKPEKSGIGVILIIVNILGLFVLLFLLLLLYKNNKQLKKKIMENQKNIVLDHTDVEKRDDKEVEISSKMISHHENDQGKLEFVDGVLEFELGDLMKASAESLGKGNFGNTYRARLEDGRNVIVKRLRDLKPLSSDEFIKQLKAISAQKHPNLAPILAYYFSKNEKLLVQKFIANGNLFSRLHAGRGTSDRIPLRWSERLLIARGVARALEYLHINPNSHTQVPHGNLKSSNVLIDDNNMVLVSDYGFTSIISNTISVQRMFSFKSPEFLTSKKISKKSDVWSYGSLVMELLTGRLTIQSASQDENAVDLCNWVHRAVREEWTAEIFDLEIMGQRSATHGMLKLLQLAVRCCDKSPEKRPGMSEVVREVESIKVPNGDSESEDDLSGDRSLTDDSMSATPSR